MIPLDLSGRSSVRKRGSDSFCELSPEFKKSINSRAVIDSFSLVADWKFEMAVSML